MNLWLVLGVLGFFWYQSKSQTPTPQPNIPNFELPPTNAEIDTLVANGVRREDAEAMTATQVRQLLRGQYQKGIIDFLP